MNSLTATARTSGALYLVLAVTGALGFLLIRPAIVVPGDAAATLANLLDQDALARLGIALELLTVLSQSALAVWFFKLFRGVDVTAAMSLAAFGLINAVAILASAAFSSTALAVASDPALAPTDGMAETVQLMYQLGATFWGVGGLFFGLWLIPMGLLVIRSRWMPRPLGWVLIAGGLGYVVSVFITYVIPAPGVVVEALAILATVGEFWMLGYLLIFGVRRGASVPAEVVRS
jgi:hypothetical protein